MPDPRIAAVIVLAAGEGTRMRSTRTPKVLHELCGRTMLGHVVAAARGLSPEQLLVVVGHGREQVVASLEDGVTPVVQAEQRGTGHAVAVALEALEAEQGTVVVVPGDAPLLTTATLTDLVTTHELRHAATTLLTAEPADPTGYGRVVRDGGAVTAVVEQRDADDAVLQIGEVATSVYAFSLAELRTSLSQLGTDNAQGEQYLTDLVGLQVAAGRVVAGHPADRSEETAGINDRAQLAAVCALLRARIVHDHLLAGVTVVDPASTWIDVGVALEPDVVLQPGVQLRGSTRVGAGAVIGPDSTLLDTEVGPDASVVRSHCTGAVVGERASVGPFSYLRPGARLERGAKVGAFVEVKGSTIGEGSKVPHLSYVGDTTIGARSNVGAATVTVNYDGRAKHRTTIGDDVRIGSDTMLVAPVTVGDGAWTAAGSVITSDVPPGALGVGRARQRNVEGWVSRTRPKQGEPSA